MSRLIMIAGHPGGGTTFVASLLHKLGYDLGEETAIFNKRNDDAGKQVRGREHRPLHNLLVGWNMRLFPGFTEATDEARSTAVSPIAIDDPMVADMLRDEVAEVSTGLPEVVKNPILSRWLALWLMAGGKRPDFTVLCMRNTLESSISNWKDGFGGEQQSPNERRINALFNYGFLLETLLLNDLAWAPVVFPRSVAIPNHVWDMLPFIREEHTYDTYLAAWDKVADPALIRTGAADVEEFRRTKVVDPAPLRWAKLQVTEVK